MTRSTGRVLPWLGGLLAVWLVLPVLLFVAHAPGQLDPALRTPGLAQAVTTSVLSASASTLLIVVFGVPLARTLARSRSVLARVVGVLVQLPLALPPVMSGIVLIGVVGPYTWLGERFGGNLTDTFTGVVIAQTFVAAPFLVVAARSAFAALDADVDDLAAAAGLGRAARFWRVDLPLAVPGIIAGALLTWLRALGEYGATSLLAYHPYTLPVYVAVQFDGSGLPGTVAPTLLALTLAGGMLVLLGVPWRRPHRAVRVPAAEPPPGRPPVRVGFDLHQYFGDFELQVRHTSRSSRLAILGPSGAGKSLTLRAIAGLVDAGSVTLDGERVDALLAERRRIGWVPQSRLLFEHRSVWRNATFSPRAEPGRAAWWLDALGIAPLAGRMPATLSGGERQRASLVQALAHDPRVLLLDEPFSALDSPTREELRRLLRTVQQRQGLSTVLVTHDPRDALLLADEVVVVVDGRVAQAGPVSEVFARPVDATVARLVGTANVLPGVMDAPGTVRVLGHLLAGHGPYLLPGTPVLVRLAPVGLRLLAPESQEGLPARVIDVLDTLDGAEVRVRVDAEPTAELVCTGVPGPGDGPRPGDGVRLTVDAVHVTWWTPAVAAHPGSRSPGLRENGTRE